MHQHTHHFQSPQSEAANPNGMQHLATYYFKRQKIIMWYQDYRGVRHFTYIVLVTKWQSQCFLCLCVHKCMCTHAQCSTELVQRSKELDYTERSQTSVTHRLHNTTYRTVRSSTIASFLKSFSFLREGFSVEQAGLEHNVYTPLSSAS